MVPAVALSQFRLHGGRCEGQLCRHCGHIRNLKSYRAWMATWTLLSGPSKRLWDHISSSAGLGMTHSNADCMNIISARRPSSKYGDQNSELEPCRCIGRQITCASESSICSQSIKVAEQGLQFSGIVSPWPMTLGYLFDWSICTGTRSVRCIDGMVSRRLAALRPTASCNGKQPSCRSAKGLQR